VIVDYNIYVIYNIYKNVFGGSHMTTQMIIRIDDEIKRRLNKLARLEGKTTSEMVRELIEERIKERDISAYIDGLWNRIGKKLESKGVTPSTIENAIKASRKKQG
jgi:macrodomain Ter protein organizer (MatP/YcbG family)